MIPVPEPGRFDAGRLAHGEAGGRLVRPPGIGAGGIRAVPDAKFVKAFNTISAQALGDAAGAQVLYTGDDAGAKESVRGLIESAGFEVVDSGPPVNARRLERLGMPHIFLGDFAGRGTGVAPAWLTAVTPSPAVSGPDRVPPGTIASATRNLQNDKERLCRT